MHKFGVHHAICAYIILKKNSSLSFFAKSLFVYPLCSFALFSNFKSLSPLTYITYHSLEMLAHPTFFVRKIENIYVFMFRFTAITKSLYISLLTLSSSCKIYTETVDNENTLFHSNTLSLSLSLFCVIYQGVFEVNVLMADRFYLKNFSVHHVAF